MMRKLRSIFDTPLIRNETTKEKQMITMHLDKIFDVMLGENPPAENPFYRKNGKLFMKMNGMKFDFDKGRVEFYYNEIHVGSMDVQGLRSFNGFHLTEVEVHAQINVDR